jgi:hypothetical protein
VSKGVAAKKDELRAAFETDETDKIIRIVSTHFPFILLQLAKKNTHTKKILFLFGRVFVELPLPLRYPQILEKGELQVSEKERQQQIQNTFKVRLVLRDAVSASVTVTVAATVAVTVFCGIADFRRTSLRWWLRSASTRTRSGPSRSPPLSVRSRRSTSPST